MAATGEGKGGQVIIIAGILFVGYLYFTKRLPNVYAAISNPGQSMTPPLSTQGQPTATTPPINPSYPRTFTLLFPLQNHPPITITAQNQVDCQQKVMDACAMAGTGATLAEVMTATFCTP